jgi:hypothetical protein
VIISKTLKLTKTTVITIGTIFCEHIAFLPMNIVPIRIAIAIISITGPDSPETGPRPTAKTAVLKWSMHLNRSVGLAFDLFFMFSFF